MGSFEGITVNDLTIDEFIHVHKIKKHELFQENVLMITRVFDARIRAFINKIVMAKNAPLNVMYYTYRIEFQARGMPHLHGQEI